MNSEFQKPGKLRNTCVRLNPNTEKNKLHNPSQTFELESFLIARETLPSAANPRNQSVFHHCQYCSSRHCSSRHCKLKAAAKKWIQCISRKNLQVASSWTQWGKKNTLKEDRMRFHIKIKTTMLLCLDRSSIGMFSVLFETPAKRTAPREKTSSWTEQILTRFLLVITCLWLARCNSSAGDSCYCRIGTLPRSLERNLRYRVNQTLCVYQRASVTQSWHRFPEPGRASWSSRTPTHCRRFEM